MVDVRPGCDNSSWGPAVGARKMLLIRGVSDITFPASGMEHVPTCQPAHTLSMLKLLLTEGARTVISFIDVGDHIEGPRRCSSTPPLVAGSASWVSEAPWPREPLAVVVAVAASELELPPPGGWNRTHVAQDPEGSVPCQGTCAMMESHRMRQGSSLEVLAAYTADGRRECGLGACCCSTCNSATGTAACCHSDGVPHDGVP